MRKKLITAIIALTLALSCLVGVTVAWLFVDTDPVVNTFSPSNIELTLEESKDLDFQMIPGKTITKDPKVTLTADIDCYVFVKIDKSTNYGTYLAEYGVADGWIALDGVAGVYYQVVYADETFEDVSVLKGDQVAVLDTVTKDDMALLYKDGAVNNDACPTLTFTAYAIQKDGFATAEDAWPYALAQSNTLPTT